jgi:hypothetical protein
MPVTVRVPHGMAWCAGGRAVVEAEGSTLRELWASLHTAFPELMWRLSLEQGPPSFWVRIYLDGRPVDRRGGFDTEIPDGALVTLHVLHGAGLGGNT